MQVKHFFGLNEKEHHGLGEPQFLKNIEKCGVDPDSFITKYGVDTNSFVVNVGMDKIHEVKDKLGASIFALNSEKGRDFLRFIEPRIESIEPILKKLKGQKKPLPAAGGEEAGQEAQAFDENAVLVPYDKLKQEKSWLYNHFRDKARSRPLLSVAVAAVENALEMHKAPGGKVDLRQFIADVIAHDRLKSGFVGQVNPSNQKEHIESVLPGIKKRLNIT